VRLEPERRGDIVTLNAAGSRPPLFFFHGDLSGGGFYGLTLARHLGTDQPLHLVHPLGADGGDLPPTLEAMAAAHAQAIRAVQPGGPYRLGGYCNGGLVAYETARLLELQGEQIERVALVAAAPYTHPSWLGQTLDTLRRRARLGQRARGGLRGVRSLLERLSGARERSATGASPNGHEPLRLPAHYPELYGAYVTAVRAYVPRSCATRLLVFWPVAEPAPVTDDDALGWRRLVAAVEVEAVPGDHNTVITEQVPLIARRLAEFLT
jgi:thioesterase domain-containing protein